MIKTCFFSYLNIKQDMGINYKSDTFFDNIMFNLKISLIKNHRPRTNPYEPDFYIDTVEGRIYIEVKKIGSGLNKNQCRWFFENKDKDLYILYLEILSHGNCKKAFNVFDPRDCELIDRLIFLRNKGLLLNQHFGNINKWLEVKK